jgi:hypothetical protein
MSTAVLTGQQGFGCFDRVMWFGRHKPWRYGHSRAGRAAGFSRNPR